MVENSIKKAKELIQEKRFEEAESFLLKLEEKKQSSEVNYLLGYIHHVNIVAHFFSEDEKKFKGSEEKAKEFLKASIEFEEPIEDAFLRLANIEKNKKHAVRILKRGLEYFPNSEGIYSLLLSISENIDISKICKEIKDKNINSNTLYFKMYEFFFEQKNYYEALKNIEKIKVEAKYEEQLLDLIKAFCFFELNDIEKAKSIFQNLIDVDVNQKLNYAQYLGLLLCFLIKEEVEPIIDLSKEFPYRFEDLFVHIDFTWGFNFKGYFYDSIEKALSLLKSKKEYKEVYAKLKGIRALKDLENESINKKIIADLKFARNNLPNKEIFDIALVEAYRYTNQEVEALDQDLKNIVEYSDYESQVEFILFEISKVDLKKIVGLFLIKLNNASSWYRKKFKEIVKNIVPALFKEENYEDVIKIINYFSVSILETSGILFEVAYSYSEIGDKVNAKRFYEMIWKKNQSIGAVANNLALLYEDEDDRCLAKKLFEKALKLNPDDVIARNNLLRVNRSLEEEARDIKKWNKEQEIVLGAIKKENIYIHEKIYCLINAEDDNGHIAASYGQLPGIFKATPEKTQDLIKVLQEKKYISKVQNHNINTSSNVYRLNNLVREFILERKRRIEENKPFSDIGERISLDSFEELGLDENLLQKIDLKILDSDLIKILKRDLRENALALLTESYKTALVLSGSIIEALILQKVRSSGIVKYLSNANAKKKKRVVEMDISELLFVADENNIIDIQLYHFSQALKHYRNYIHPAVEIRKGGSRKISKNDANIAWSITKKIIAEI